MRVRNRLIASVLALSMLVAPLANCRVAAAVDPDEKIENLSTTNIAKAHGYRAVDVLNWDPETDEFAKDLQACVPLQERIEPFAATQANPDLSPDTELYNLTGDYRTTDDERWMSSYDHNGDFSNYLHMFWQYEDYYGGWHGGPIAGADETSKYVNGSLLNLPNPAYTNAAHRNGVKSVGCLFIPRSQLYIEELLYKDENGEFPYAKKMIEMMRYFGFDGYFINQEARFDSSYVTQYKEFIRYLRSEGAHIVWYDCTDSSTGSGPSYQPKLISSHAGWLYDDKVGGQVSDAMFINYNWNTTSTITDSNGDGLHDNVGSTADLVSGFGLDPLKNVYMAVECNQGNFSGSHNSSRNLDLIFNQKTGNPGTAIALFTPNFVQTALDHDLGNSSTKHRFEDDYQWMIHERDRMYYTSMLQDVKKTDKVAGFSYPEAGVNNGSGWTGVSRYVTERSVLNGTTFYTNFNTGHGLQYFMNGTLSNDNEWSNMSLQSMLPTWQWWLDKADEDAASLKADFDFGENYVTGANTFEKIGAYNGGSSLVIGGKLETTNTFRLYKSALDVNEASTFDVTFNKSSSDDASTMSLALYFQDAPETPELVAIPDSGKQTDGWVTKSVSLSEYAGRTIAAFGLSFDAGEAAVEGYQINIGEITLKDGASHTPAKPEGLHVIEANPVTGELRMGWTMEDYDTVKGYELTAVYEDGSEVFLGGTYGQRFYILDTYNTDENFTIKLYAVGADGTRSVAAETVCAFADHPADLAAESTFNGLNASWTLPEGADYDEILCEVTYDNDYSNTEGDRLDSLTVAGDAVSATIPLGRYDGSKYTLTLYPVVDGVKMHGVSVKGFLVDNYSEPYDGKAIYRNSKLTFDIPRALDWAFMHLNINGSTSKLERLKSNLQNISFNGTGMITVTMEDVNGNLSAPVVFQFANGEVVDPSDLITEEHFPDPALLDAVRKQVGVTLGSLEEFTGTLNLTGSAVADLTGLERLTAMTGLNFTNCTALESITDLSACAGLKEVNLSGCTGLKTVDLSGLGLEKLEGTGSYPALISVDISNNKLDLSEGTPERTFLDAALAATEGKDVPSELGENLTLGMTADNVVASANCNNPGYLFDGIIANESQAYGKTVDGVSVTVDLGEVKQIGGFAIGGLMNQNDSPRAFGMKGAKLEIANELDGEYVEVARATLEYGTEKGEAIEASAMFEAVEGRYARITVTEWFLKADGSVDWKAMFEANVYGPSVSAPVKFQNQRPAAYSAIIGQEVAMELALAEGETLDMAPFAEEAATIRGTAYETLGDQRIDGKKFIADDLDLNAKPQETFTISIADQNKNPVEGSVIDLGIDATYTVNYLNEAGEVVAVYTVTVGDGGEFLTPVCITDNAKVLYASINPAENSPNEGPEKAFDHSESTKWCPGKGVVESELIIDVGAYYAVTQWNMSHSGVSASDGSTRNTRDYALQMLKVKNPTAEQLADEAFLTNDDNWETIKAYVDNRNSRTEDIFEDSYVGRYFRLHVTKGSDPIAYATTRIYEWSMMGILSKDSGGEEENVEITVAPKLAQVEQGATQQFTAEVTGTANTGVTWSIDKAESADTKIDENGLLTVGADETAAVLAVVATSNADPSKTAGAMVVVVVRKHAIVVDDAVVNGTVTADKTEAVAGETITLTVAADEGYVFAAGSLKVNGKSIEGNTFVMPNEDVVITAAFNKLYNISANAVNGAITADKSQAVAGETVTLTVEAAYGYKLVEGSLKVNGEVIEGNAFVMPEADALVTAEFEIDLEVNALILGEELKAYCDALLEQGYSEEGRAAMADALDEALAALNAAETVEAQEAAVAAGKAAMDAVKTLADELNDIMEEANKAVLAAQKYYALLEIKGIANTELNVDQKALVDAVVEEAYKAVRAAETIEEVQEIVESVRSEVERIKNLRCAAEEFSDVSLNDWFHEDADFMLNNGYMNGYPGGTFRPDVKVSRAQLVTILYRVAGEPEVSGEVTFSDVAEDYYTSAVIWAADFGITTGYTDGTFRPNAEVSRQELVTFLYRFAEAEAVEEDHLTAFPDADKVADYAVESMNWAIANGIVSGAVRDNVLVIAPEDTARRDETCAIVARYMNAN